MEIHFATSQMRKLAEDFKRCQKQLGAEGAKRFFMRINSLQSAETLEDVRHLPGHFHELTGNRKGQWACDLVHPYRLLFCPQQVPPPVNAAGSISGRKSKA